MKKIIGRVFFRSLVKQLGGGIGDGSKVVKPESWSHISLLNIGNNVYIGPGARIFCKGKIVIGDSTIIGPKATFYSSNHNFYSDKLVPYDNKAENITGVNIGNGCWVGDSCLFLPGSVVGDHCLIGAGSVIRGHFPSGSIIVGNPARVVKSLSSEQLNNKQELFKNKKFYLEYKYQ